LDEVPDPEVHEGHGEVHGLLPLVGNGEVSNGMVVMMYLLLLLTGYLIPRFMKGMEKSTACSLS
jgi:hypothetical protein